MTVPHPRAAFLAVASSSLLLILLACRHGPLLGIDPYYYVEFAKRYAVEWPDRFGNHWPVGWPLAGGLLARLGLPAYPALVLLEVTALLTTLSLAARIARDSLRGATFVFVLLAIGAAPELASQVGEVMSELPLAAIALLLAWQLSGWPARRAIWSCAPLAIAGISVRYAGLFLVAVLAVWIAAQGRSLLRTRRLWHALAAWGVAVLVIAGLLAINFFRTGYASGADRGAGHSWFGFPAELATFGWSGPSALVGDGFRERLAGHPAAWWLIGAGGFISVLALGLAAWFRPTDRHSRPLALLTLGYAFAMAFFHTIGGFDPISVGRTFVPILAPVALLAAARFRHRPAFIHAACAVLVALALAAALRGTSRQIAGDVRAAVPVLRGALHRGDRVGIDANSYSLAAYLGVPVERETVAGFRDHPGERFFAASAAPLDRVGTPGPASTDERAARALAATPGFRLLVDTPQVVVVVRGAPAVSP